MLLVALWVPLVALAPPLAPQAPLPALLQALATLPPGPERTLKASELLLDRPYLHHPLGDGEPPDSAPRFQVEGFDCQTFVETALALGTGRSEAGVRAALDDLRYRGAPAFASRNHYMMSQWVPANVAKGYLQPPLAGSAVAEKVITERSWASRWPKDIALPVEQRPLGTFRLPITPLGELMGRVANVPSGTVLLIVRAERASFPDRVTHLGLLVHRGGQTYFRHASDVFHRVVDEPLTHFITRNQRYAYAVEGVALLPLRDNAERVAALR